MTKRHTPPGRTSISCVVRVKPRGPHQFATCSRLVHMSNTSSRGASNVRRATISRDSSISAALLLSLMAAMSLLLLALQFAQVFVQTVEALLPELAVVGEPVVDLFQRPGIEAARPPLGLAPAGDESRALEHFQVLGDRGHAHVEGLGKLRHRAFAGQ